MRNVTAPLALGLAAAASLAQAQDLSGEVTVWSWNIAASSLEAVAEGFVAQNPGVTVTVEDLGNAQVFDRMLAGCAAGGAGSPSVRSCGGCVARRNQPGRSPRRTTRPTSRAPS